MANHPQTVEDAAALLRAGGICAFPTETVYGLGAKARDSNAVLAIYETKQRPRFNPLIVHCADLGMARRFAQFTPLAERFAQVWPASLTLVLPLAEGAGLSDLVTAGLDTVGIRIPAHPLARDLIAEVGEPLAAPSANPSGRLSPTSAAQVKSLFADQVPVLDGGRAEAGVESTIISLIGDRPVQLRAGAMARDALEQQIGMPIPLAEEGAAIASPGMLASHYAPRARLRLNADAPGEGERYIGFGADPSGLAAANLSPSGDLREAAYNLFSVLHMLDDAGDAPIAVAPIPATGLGEAINDRLKRAAAPR
ncbi:threonylcarbamoyl-AMP synthase [Devosia pacifica]|uniref:Threonylcarbamoyl-AMP synthase n=1 Tax=Devosia pacifica TaxID=1335967 RepID=A0A918S9A8_9HYPH|nr:L-threonylcarbamoyladenylate synthase [Devosia pacifica]GHA30142.1 threonylcarbamoyl-AMP synthase [Devosia pacifica]